MVCDRTSGMDPTHTGTGVATLVVYAGFVPRTLGVYDTFRLALHIGVAYVVSYTSTRGGSTVFGTLGIDAARGRIARTNDLYGSLGD